MSYADPLSGKGLCRWLIRGAIGLCCVLSVNAANAGDAPEVDAANAGDASEVELRHEIELDLNAAIAIALENNFGVAVRRVERASALEDVAIAKAAFEPALAGFGQRNTSASFQGTPGGEFDEYTAILSEKVPTGGILTLTADTQRNEFGLNFPGEQPYTSALHLAFRQPLLKGGGYFYNHSPIVLGRIAVNESDYELRKSILDLLRNAEIAYWELVYAYKAADVRQQTIENAERLQRETRERGNVGLATGVEPLQADAALAARIEELVIAKQAIGDNTDRLLLLLGSVDKKNYLVRTTADFPVVVQPAMGDGEIDRMIEQLPDYREFDQLLARRRILVRRARNEALPQVDAGIGGGYTGFGTGYSSAYRNAFRNDQHDWQSLFEIHIPLGFGQERANLRKRKYELQIDELRRREFQQQVRAQIRENMRAVTAGNERVRATSDFLRLSHEQNDQLRGKFLEGLAPFRDMLLAQDDLREASIRAISAQLAAVEARIRLARYDGTLLQRYGLSWFDPVSPDAITPASQSQLR